MDTAEGVAGGVCALDLASSEAAEVHADAVEASEENCRCKAGYVSYAYSGYVPTPILFC